MARTRREGKSTEAINVDGVSGEKLKSYIERIERLEEEKKTTASDITEVFAEAKGTGFDTKIMRIIIKERAMDKDDLDEQETLLDVYRLALGMKMPLFAAADDREETDDEAPPMRHIGEVAAKVVEEVAGKVALAAAETRGKDDFAIGHSILKPPTFKTEGETAAWDKGFNKAKKAHEAQQEKDAAKTALPEKQTAAKLAGEAAGAKGELHTVNPYPVAHPLYGWWSKGWKNGADELAAKGKPANGANGNAEKVTPIRGKGREGFVDKTPRMSPEQAAALLGAKAEGTS